MPSPSTGPKLHEGSAPAFLTAFRSLLDDASFYPRGGILGFGLYHKYPLKSNEDKRPISPFRPKGRDAIIYDAFGELDLLARVAYFYEEEGLEVLCNRRLNVEYEEFDSDENALVAFMSGEGQVLRTDSRDSYSYSGSSDFDDDEVKQGGSHKVPHFAWAKELNDLNVTTDGPFITYGNEHSTEFCYGHGCLVVEIGPPGEREGIWEPIRPRRR